MKGLSKHESDPQNQGVIIQAGIAGFTFSVLLPEQNKNTREPLTN